MSVKEGASASRWSCEESPLQGGEMVCFLFAGRQQDRREAVVCLPSGHTALGAAGSTAALECVCMCVSCVCMCVLCVYVCVCMCVYVLCVCVLCVLCVYVCVSVCVLCVYVLCVCVL